MKRTELKRTPFARTASTTKKAAPAPRQRKCAVKTCRALFAPRSMTHKTCGMDCALALVQDEKERALKAERQAGLQKLKRKADYLREAQAAFNAYIRFRDRLAGHGCISSGRPLDWSGNAVDAGHYRSVGSAPHLRFNEDNVHAQSKHDNQWKSGNAVDYRLGLIVRIGLARVEALEANDTPAHWSVDDLKALKATYVAKLKALKKRQ